MPKRNVGRAGDGVRLAGRTHIWRHTMVTLARELTHAQILRGVVGHTTEQVHERYQHAHSADVISLAEALGHKLGGASVRKQADSKESSKPRRK